MVKTYGQLYREVARMIEPVEGPMAANTARELLAHLTGKPQAALMAMSTLYVSDTTAEAYVALAQRILDQEPLAYILGEWDFYGLRLTVTPDVLIPRDDTMAVVDLAMEEPLPASPRILDLCTGSGCIGLALATRCKDARVTLADISKEALAVAKKNVASVHFSGRVSCVQADALAPAPAFLGKFDMIVSNPPYITGPEMLELPSSVDDYEPHLALYGGEDGLDFYRSITENYKAALKPGGYLCFEFGMGQGDDVCNILIKNGFTIIERTKDFNDRERAVIAQLSRKED